MSSPDAAPNFVELARLIACDTPDLNRRQLCLTTPSRRQESNRRLFTQLLSSCDNATLNEQEERSGCTALHYALGSDHAWLIAELLRAPGIQINIQDLVGETAFHLAVKRQSVTVVQQLLDQHICDFTLVSDNNGWSVFHHAVSRPDGIEMLELLLCARTKMIDSGTPKSTELINLGPMYTPLGLAVRYRNAAAVDMLLRHGASTLKRNRFTALMHAALDTRYIETQEWYDCLQLLVSRSHEYLLGRDEEDATALEQARDIVADWNEEHMTPENVWRIKVKSHLIGLIEQALHLELIMAKRMAQGGAIVNSKTQTLPTFRVAELERALAIEQIRVNQHLANWKIRLRLTVIAWCIFLLRWSAKRRAEIWIKGLCRVTFAICLGLLFWGLFWGILFSYLLPVFPTPVTASESAADSIVAPTFMAQFVEVVGSEAFLLGVATQYTF